MSVDNVKVLTWGMLLTFSFSGSSCMLRTSAVTHRKRMQSVSSAEGACSAMDLLARQCSKSEILTHSRSVDGGALFIVGAGLEEEDLKVGIGLGETTSCSAAGRSSTDDDDVNFLRDHDVPVARLEVRYAKSESESSVKKEREN